MKKALSIIKATVTWLLVVAAVVMMVFTVISVNTFDKTDRDIFGYKAFIVLTNSMSSTDGDRSKGYFNAGDVVLINKNVDYNTLDAGDIIAFISNDQASENYGKVVTHMIRERTVKDGVHGFITYGTATGSNDSVMVEYAYVLGKYSAHIPALGHFFRFLKTTPGYIVCILLPFLLLILMQGFNSIRLFKLYKQEQLDEIEAERARERESLEAERVAIAEERKKQEEMMARLLEMQEKLQQSMPTAEEEGKEKKDTQ